MSLIGEILPLSHIVLDMEVGSKKRLFEEAGLLLERESSLSHADVFECLFAREKLGSTGLGQGVAIPHGRHAGVKQATGAFIRTREPVGFDAPDGKPVSLIFILLVMRMQRASIWRYCPNWPASFPKKASANR